MSALAVVQKSSTFIVHFDFVIGPYSTLQHNNFVGEAYNITHYPYRKTSKPFNYHEGQQHRIHLRPCRAFGGRGILRRRQAPSRHEDLQDHRREGQTKSRAPAGGGDARGSDGGGGRCVHERQPQREPFLVRKLQRVSQRRLVVPHLLPHRPRDQEAEGYGAPHVAPEHVDHGHPHGTSQGDGTAKGDGATEGDGTAEGDIGAVRLVSHVHVDVLVHVHVDADRCPDNLASRRGYYDQ